MHKQFYKTSQKSPLQVIFQIQLSDRQSHIELYRKNYTMDGQCQKASTMTEILPQKSPQILVIFN